MKVKLLETWEEAYIISANFNPKEQELGVRYNNLVA